MSSYDSRDNDFNVPVDLHEDDDGTESDQYEIQSTHDERVLMAHSPNSSAMSSASAALDNSDDLTRDYQQQWGARLRVYYRRHRTAIFLGAGLLLTVFVALILIPLVIPASDQPGSSDSDAPPSPTGPRFSFNNIFSLGAKRTSLRWLSDGVSYTQTSAQGVITMVTLTPPSLELSTVVIYDPSQHPDLGLAGSYTVSPDKSTLLLGFNRTQQWRHSFFADYVLLNIESQQWSPLVSKDQDEIAQQQSAQWCPTGELIAYVMSNNVYIANVSAPGFPTTKVTDDGGEDYMNGVQSWVYEEEIFSAMSAMWWSPDCTSLAFFLSDQRDVQVYEFPVWQGPDYKVGQGPGFDAVTYPSSVRIKYPRPGTTNPKVFLKIHVIGEKRKPRISSISSETAGGYLTGVWWRDSGRLLLRTMPRLQNEETLHEIMLAGDLLVNVTLSNVIQQNGWIDTTYEIGFLDSNHFLNVVVDPTSGFNHLALYELRDDESSLIGPTFLTSGNWDVTTINAYVPNQNKVYITTTQSSSIQRELYSVVLDLSLKAASAPVLEGPANIWTTCSFPQAQMYGYLTPNNTYYFMQLEGDWSFLNVPQSILRSLSAPDQLILEDNAVLKSNLTALDLPGREQLNVVTPTDTLNGYVMYPPDYDPSRVYPMLVHIYGGPGSQQVQQRFQLDFDVFLASSNYIIGVVDGRGTGYRGRQFTQQIYKQLGVLETEDLISAGRFYRQTLPIRNLAIWGWSYGGYMASRVASSPLNQGVYNASIATAPVTDWRFYDSTYTERYMQQPLQNPAGYELSSVLPDVGNIVNVQYLLMHGSGDDNVHYSNTAQLAKELVEQDIPYQMMVFTNDNHAISSSGARRFLDRLIFTFLNRVLDVST